MSKASQVRMISRVSRLLAVVALLPGLSTPATAQTSGRFTADTSSIRPSSTSIAGRSARGGFDNRRFLAAANPDGKVGVVVKLRTASLASYKGGAKGLPATSPAATGAARLDINSTAARQYRAYVNQQLDSFRAKARQVAPAATVIHRFDIIIGGVSMVVPATDVPRLADLPEVEAVYLDTLEHLDTEASPKFIGAKKLWGSLGGPKAAGEGVVVGVLDSGIWPEHPSFSDPDPSGKAYPAPPSAPVGSRACSFAGGANPGPAFTCNNKLIGADRFMATYDAVNALGPGEFTSARDDDGHGTHTCSTAAGNGTVVASIFGIPRGKVSGIAPRAHVIMYKVCGNEGCYGSDSAAAVQEAIQDGVNVINFSISGGSNPYGDVVELAFLDAYNAGLFVAASAGNSGPGLDTTDHRGPWVTTVAASTQKRIFANKLKLKSSDGAKMDLTGTSITDGISTPTAVVVPSTDLTCNGPFAPGTFANQIVLCKRGVTGRVAKGFAVLQGGAAGMILYNDAPAITARMTDSHFLPTSHIQFSEGQDIIAFLSTHPAVTATMTSGKKKTSKVHADVMASFSSRGGPGQTLGASKPDVTAPGVQILAGETPVSVSPSAGPQGELFQAIAGTSMSSPHVAGAAALLKALHPDWTAGQVKSALMLTAVTQVLKEDSLTPADAFDLGTGRISLGEAGDPGLSIDETGAQYLALEESLWDANYPSVFVPNMPGLFSVSRTVHSLLEKNSSWNLSVTSPADLRITVPSQISVSAGGDTSFEIEMDARAVPAGQARFATVTLSQLTGGGKRVLHIPVTIVRGAPADIVFTKSCTPASILVGNTTGCTIQVTNNTKTAGTFHLLDVLPPPLQLVSGSVTGATPTGNALSVDVPLAGKGSPTISIAPGPSVAGYIPLSSFGIAPIAGVGDDTITSFNVPAFTYAGETYTQVGVSSNGYVVVGPSTSADSTLVNQSLPNPAVPNNVLAAYWTDLNPAAAGAVRIGTLTDGVDTWIVVDWEGVQEFSNGSNLHSFDIWIGIDTDANPAMDVSFAYGPQTGSGDGGALTVGAENRDGDSGNNAYFNGSGTLPADGTAFVVSGAAPAMGGSHTVTFSAQGVALGEYVNYAELNSDIFPGTYVVAFPGEVVAP